MREPHHASVVEDAVSLYRGTRKDSITLFFSRYINVVQNNILFRNLCTILMFSYVK